MKKNTGITLIALIITIIVLLILAGVSINALVGDNGVISNARKSSISHELTTMKEDLELNRAALDAVSYEQGHGAADFSIYVTGEDVREYIPNIPDKYVGQVAIFDGELVLLGNNISQEDKQTAESLGIKVMEDTDYNYMLEMKYLELAVLAHKDDTTKIGTPLGTTENPYETIAGINYGLGWYKITTQAELTSLGITTEQMGYMNHIPYIVKYSTGAVQSIAGKMMYAGTDYSIWKYTFNYKGEDGGLITKGLLSGVIRDSNKEEDCFGEFVYTKTYATSNDAVTPGTIENHYVDPYTYTTDGGVILTENTNILFLPLSQQNDISSKFSFMITIKADLSQKGTQNRGAALAGISTNTNTSTLALLLYKNKLGFASYNRFTSGNYGWGYQVLENVTGQYIPGYGVQNVSAYNNKYLNIIETAERGGKMKLYLNGALVQTIEAGNEVFNYQYITIGDGRPGRGYKFVGNVYNAALYGDVLTDEEVAQNWNYVKNELGINEAGDKVTN